MYHEIEGTWEYIQAHSADLAGRHVKLIVLDEDAPTTTQEDDMVWENRMLQKVGNVTPLPEETQDDRMEQALARLAAAHQRHQGHVFSDSTALVREDRNR